MRAVFLVLLLVVAGCAHRSTPPTGDRAMPADFAGTVTYSNGSLPPPYHYEWTVTFDAHTAEVEWRPSYDEEQAPWRETADVTDDQRAGLYALLRDAGVFDGQRASEDGMVGGPGGRVEVTADGRTYDPGSLGGSKDSARLLEQVAGAVEKLFPADVWAGLRAKQHDWEARHPK